MAELLQTMIDAISLGSLYALAALGVGLLFGVLRLINFAQGDFITAGAYTLIYPSAGAVTTVVVGGWQPVPLVLTVCSAVVLLALATDRLVFSRLRSADPANLMIASFATSYVVQNMLLLIYGSRPKAIGLWPGLMSVVEFWGLRVPQLQIVTAVTTLILLLALRQFLSRTHFGLQMRAAAEDFAMARYLGVKANRVIAIAFAISGALAAVVSLLYITQTGVLTPTLGTNIVLFAFIATVVGGMGSLTGAILGGFVIGFVSTVLQVYLPADIRPFRDAFLFAFLILILTVRPSGIMKVRSLEERV